MLEGQGYNVTLKSNDTAGDNNVSVADFKNLGQYDVVVISSHGDNSVIRTRESDADLLTNPELLKDYVACRVVDVGGVLGVTPSFISFYSGHMDGTVVYISACFSNREHAFR